MEGTREPAIGTQSRSGAPSSEFRVGESADDGRQLRQQQQSQQYQLHHEQHRDQTDMLARPPKPHHPRAGEHGSDGDGSPPPHLSSTTSGTASTPTSSTTGSHGSSEIVQVTHSHIPATRPNVPSEYTSESGTTAEPPAVPLPAGSSVESALKYGAYDHGTQPELPHPEQCFDGSGRYNPHAFTSAVKLLVSNNVAGSIIGRSGQTISDLQTQSATRIKLSQSGDYYPGTQDRVCLVQGQSDNVKKAMSLLLTRLYALQQQQHYHHFAWQRQQQERAMIHDPVYGSVHDPLGTHPSLVPAFAFVVRVLVPTPCCGMIIGKGGSNIKQMVDSSGVSSVRLSPKEGGGDTAGLYPPTASPAAAAAVVSATSERVVTITGPDLNSCLKCMFIILDGMTSNPEISRYANMTTSYSRVMSAAQSALGVAGAVGVRRSNSGHQLTETPGLDAYVGGQVQASSSFGAIDGQFIERQNSLPSPAPGGFVHLRGSDPHMGYDGSNQPPLLPEPQAFRQSPSRPTLQPNQANPGYFVQSPGAYMQPPPAQLSEAPTQSSGSMSSPDLLALQMQDSMRMNEPALMDPSSSQQFVPQVPQQTHSPPGFQAQVAIPDSLIGSILGRGGRTLNELQLLSNTRIRISQRGEFVPGTKNRVVTVRGQTLQSVTAAQYMMSQRMVLPPTAYAHQPQQQQQQQQQPERVDAPPYGMPYSQFAPAASGETSGGNSNNNGPNGPPHERQQQS
eukprot:CAMPEP_0194035200 /NCGR_PEP_ID=MMETSP0009_2-20130614/7658_1 /TAXON_ID=210454 /ORGANISM="Grammatophora oceanica, Strain CCMP 410" /LENGTH=731 /DNA_ID=CAMNT_0038676467 /DNA_START=380 /DNA_END=2575 /DNA_ORIENTATION=+